MQCDTDVAKALWLMFDGANNDAVWAEKEKKERKGRKEERRERRGEKKRKKKNK